MLGKVGGYGDSRGETGGGLQRAKGEREGAGREGGSPWGTNTSRHIRFRRNTALTAWRAYDDDRGIELTRPPLPPIYTPYNSYWGC